MPLVFLLVFFFSLVDGYGVCSAMQVDDGSRRESPAAGGVGGWRVSIHPPPQLQQRPMQYTGVQC
jgi:hypothetical protein